MKSFWLSLIFRNSGTSALVVVAAFGFVTKAAAQEASPPTSGTIEIESSGELPPAEATSAVETDANNIANSKAAADNSTVATDLPGRIFVDASLRRTNADGETEDFRNTIISIDPNTGKWEPLTKGGYSVRVSPDGSTIAYQMDDTLWMCDAKRGENARRVSVVDGRPVWSPDGNELILSDGEINEDKKPQPKKPAWFVESWKVNRDGFNEAWQPVPSTDFVEDWSPDGNWLLTSSDRHPPFGRGYQLYLVSPDATTQMRLTTEPGLNVHARFSPDGKRVLFLHQRGGNSIRMINIEDGKETEIIADDGLKRVGSACWAPDGNHIAVQWMNWKIDKDGRSTLNPNDPGTDARVEIMTLEGKQRRRLTLENAEMNWLGHPDWK